jgi:hypothetical protein
MGVKSPARQTLGETHGQPEAFPRFEVANLRDVAYGRIRWSFDLKVGPIMVECRVVADEDGQLKFAAPASIKDAYSQVYSSTVSIDRAFMREVFDVVVARIEAKA